MNVGADPAEVLWLWLVGTSKVITKPRRRLRIFALFPSAKRNLGKDPGIVLRYTKKAVKVVRGILVKNAAENYKRSGLEGCQAGVPK